MVGVVGLSWSRRVSADWLFTERCVAEALEGFAWFYELMGGFLEGRVG